MIGPVGVIIIAVIAAMTGACVGVLFGCMCRVSGREK